MSPRVQAQTIQKRFRTPRIPFLLSRFDFAFKALTKGFFLFDQSFFIANGSSRIPALMKRVFLFDQSFFITHSNRLRRLNRIAVFKIASLKELFFQYYICFPTSVF
jgi:hypothetical protein